MNLKHGNPYFTKNELENGFYSGNGIDGSVFIQRSTERLVSLVDLQDITPVLAIPSTSSVMFWIRRILQWRPVMLKVSCVCVKKTIY